MMGNETSAQIGPPPVIRTVSPAGAQVTSSESMKAEWRVHNVAAVTPQPWQGPPRVLTPGQQGYGERSGWYPTVSSVSTPGISQPPPQFQVTAQLNLSGNKVVDDCQGQGGRTNGAVNSASPMSFNILVKTNFPTSSSASVRPCSQGQYTNHSTILCQYCVSIVLSVTDLQIMLGMSTCFKPSRDENSLKISSVRQKTFCAGCVISQSPPRVTLENRFCALFVSDFPAFRIAIACWLSADC